MKPLGRYWLAISLVATAFATSAALYPMLPAIIATHWNAAGVINGWMPKLGGAAVDPIGSLVTVACLILFEPIQIEEDGDDLKVRYYPTIVAGVPQYGCSVTFRCSRTAWGGATTCLPMRPSQWVSC